MGDRAGGHRRVIARARQPHLGRRHSPCRCRPEAALVIVGRRRGRRSSRGDADTLEPRRRRGLQLDEHRPHLLGDLTVTGGPGAGTPTRHGPAGARRPARRGPVAVAAGDLGQLQARPLHGRAGRGLASRRSATGTSGSTIDRCITGRIQVPAEGPAVTVGDEHRRRRRRPGVRTADVAARSRRRHGAGRTAVSRRARQRLPRHRLVDVAVDTGRVRALQLRARLARGRRGATAASPTSPSGRATAAVGGRAPGSPRSWSPTSTAIRATRSSPTAARPSSSTGSSTAQRHGRVRDLLQPQREANLRTALDEYLRFGLEAGVIHAT